MLALLQVGSARNAAKYVNSSCDAGNGVCMLYLTQKLLFLLHQSRALLRAEKNNCFKLPSISSCPSLRRKLNEGMVIKSKEKQKYYHQGLYTRETLL